MSIMVSNPQGSSPDPRRARQRALIAAAHNQATAARASATGRTESGGATRRSPPVEWLRDLVPGYEVAQEIHRGGQGVVYEAVQKSTRRRVAIKALREGPLASPAERARFEREVRVLGSLRHPDIVTIHDSGQALGHFYLVMDFVDGQPLDAYVADRGRDVRATLRLLARICEAVQAAHLRGVIHRDLKPSNILVDPDGAPHVLDFGLAKLDKGFPSPGSSDSGDFTVSGQFVGSLPWCSPEQAEGAALDVRTDVYSLGVLLYELLTGQFPYPLAGRAHEVLESVRTCPPVRPRHLRREIDDEVETILLKCLQKEPPRRYQSAGELARDLRRYLAGEPIEAKRDSGWYMLKKTLRRHRLPMAVAGSFVLMLAVFGLAMASARMRAEREADKSRQVLTFLQGMLPGVDPEDIGKGALTVREVLDHASARLERELGDHPEVAAVVHQTLGNHYSALALYVEGDFHLRKAVALRRTFTTGDDPELAEALSDLAANLQEKRDLADAEAPAREALDMRRRLFGRDSLEFAASAHDLASILVEQEGGSAVAPAPARAEHAAAPILVDEGRAREAEQLARASLAIRRRLLSANHAEVALSTGMLGWCLVALGRLDEAETALRDAVEMVRQLPGDNEPVLAARLTFLSLVLRDRGNYVEEEVALREAIDIRSRRLAPDHPALAWNLLNLAHVRRILGDLEEAESTCRSALGIYAKRRPQSTDTADCQQLLAQIYDAQGRFAEAEPLWSNCLALRRKLLPPEHPDIAFAESGLVENRAAQSGVFGTSDETAGP